MAKLAPLAPEAQRPAHVAEKHIPIVVDIIIKPENGARVMTIELPPYRKITDKDRRDAELKNGKAAAAMCDVTGQLIFLKKNVTTLNNDERPEFNGKTISTKFLSQLFQQVEKSMALADKAAVAPVADENDDEPFVGR